ncbi:four helix bundle protein [Paraflavitalea speifideaquila]
MRRAVIPVCSNIAAGAARRSKPEKNHFFRGIRKFTGSN